MKFCHLKDFSLISAKLCGHTAASGVTAVVDIIAIVFASLLLLASLLLVGGINANSGVTAVVGVHEVTGDPCVASMSIKNYLACKKKFLHNSVCVE